mgnify:FL=1
MKYAKPPLSLEQQADLLLGRGMAGDRALIIERLRVVSYYRLSGYWYPFRERDPRNPARYLDSFRSGTTFEDVWARYVFDRRLRLLAMDAIERIEVSIRTQLANRHSRAHGAFGYITDPATLPKLAVDPRKYKDFVVRVGEETERSRETFTSHFRAKYGDVHKEFPVWMATEVMTFGTVLSFFKGVEQNLKREIANEFGVPDIVLESWLLTLNAIRNICAHHGRLWNRELGVKPKFPNAAKHPEWHAPVLIGNNRVFGVLTICRYCLRRVAPQSNWPNRVRTLLADYPGVPHRDMGFPDNWEACPIWVVEDRK